MVARCAHPKILKFSVHFSCKLTDTSMIRYGFQQSTFPVCVFPDAPGTSRRHHVAETCVSAHSDLLLGSRYRRSNLWFRQFGNRPHLSPNQTSTSNTHCTAVVLAVMGRNILSAGHARGKYNSRSDITHCCRLAVKALRPYDDEYISRRDEVLCSGRRRGRFLDCCATILRPPTATAPA